MATSLTKFLAKLKSERAPAPKGKAAARVRLAAEVPHAVPRGDVLLASDGASFALTTEMPSPHEPLYIFTNGDGAWASELVAKATKIGSRESVAVAGDRVVLSSKYCSKDENAFAVFERSRSGAWKATPVPPPWELHEPIDDIDQSLSLSQSVLDGDDVIVGFPRLTKRGGVVLVYRRAGKIYEVAQVLRPKAPPGVRTGGVGRGLCDRLPSRLPQPRNPQPPPTGTTRPLSDSTMPPDPAPPTVKPTPLFQPRVSARVPEGSLTPDTSAVPCRVSECAT